MKKHRKSILLRLAVCAFAVYIGATLISLQVQINANKSSADRLNAQAAVQEAKNQETQRVLNNKDQAQFIEEEARDTLNYAMPGERVFVNAGN